MKFLVLKALEILKVKKNGNKVCCNLSVISAEGILAPSFEKQIEFFFNFLRVGGDNSFMGNGWTLFREKHLEAKLKKKRTSNPSQQKANLSRKILFCSTCWRWKLWGGIVLQFFFVSNVFFFFSLSLRLVGNSQARRLIQFSKFTNLNEMIYYLITLVLKRPLTRRKTYRNSTKEKFLIKAKIKTAHTMLPLTAK